MPVIKRKRTASNIECPKSRLDAFREMRKLISIVPDELVVKGKKADVSKVISCDSYTSVIEAWKDCMRWRKDMEDALTTMLAVAISTEQVGDQLFLMVIGDAGSGKTRFCDAFLTSSTCHALEHVTGFHSGYKGGDGEDYSLIARIDRKLLITPEGDTLMSSPSFTQVMSQQRRIFDGTSGATYKNSKEDTTYTGLRTPWIMVGTPTLMDSDQSRLGDRFLRIFLGTPSRNERREIQKRVVMSALASVKQVSSKKDKNLTENAMSKAYGLTGGYVEYLRDNSQELINGVEVDEESIAELASNWGEFASDFRARPSLAEKKEAIDTKEMPTRLTHQLVRMAVCISAAKGEKSLSEDTLALVTKIMKDTSAGKTLQIAEVIFHAGEAQARAIANKINTPEAEVRALIRFMRSKQINILRQVKGKRGGNTRNYALTRRSKELMGHFYEAE